MIIVIIAFYWSAPVLSKLQIVNNKFQSKNRWSFDNYRFIMINSLWYVRHLSTYNYYLSHTHNLQIINLYH